MQGTGLQPLIAGNWKMNGLRAEGVLRARAVADAVRERPPSCEIALCPPATLLAPLAEALEGAGIALGGQDCAAAAHGAFTGDIAAPMLADLGCRYVIVGHSERRAGHSEGDGEVRAKAEAALNAGLVPIVCVGETESERASGAALAQVGAQLAGSLPEDSDGNVVIAYEPVWAIGTGRVAAPEDISEMHDMLRARAPQVRLLYGGSVKPGNARELLCIGNVNGALVGGASLSAEDFLAICQAAGEAL